MVTTLPVFVIPACEAGSMKKKPGLRAKPNDNDTALHEEAERAFIRLAPDRDALEPHELIRPNVDVPRAVGVVLASLPSIAELLPEMKRLPGFDRKAVDELRDAALAAEYASAVFPRPPRDRSVTELATEARALHHRLLAQARALAEIEILDAAAVSMIGAARRDARVAGNLIALATMCRRSWDQIQGKTALGEDTVERAGAIGVELLEALGSRDVARPLDGDAARSADTRARALTLLVKRYDQVRRAVAYLRWDDG